jgi:hypothetical protein
LESIGLFSVVTVVLFFVAGISNLGIGFLSVSLAFGLTVLTMAHAI